MTSRGYQVLEELDRSRESTPGTTSPHEVKKALQPSRAYQRLLSRRKPSDPTVDTNPTIKYFRDISRRSIRPRRLTVDADGAPNFRPFDRTRLLERIATFQRVMNWDITHPRLTALEAALKGWVCDVKRQNEVRCLCCGARMAVRLPEPQATSDDEVDEIENELVERVVDRYLEQFVCGHKDNCPWRKQSTPMNVYEISFTNMDDVVASLKALYKHNVKILSDVQDVKIERVLEEKEINLVLRWLRMNGLDVDDEDDREAVELSVFGWRVERHGSTTILSSPSDSRRVTITDDPVNLLEEHKPWSCYVTGYKVLLEILEALCHKTIHMEEVPQTPCEEEEGEDEMIVADTSTASASNYDGTIERLNKMRNLYFDA